MKGSVAAVVLTHGDRAGFCLRVVPEVLEQGCGSVVVVDNGSADASATALRDLALAHPGRVHLLRLADNLGSAGGFAVGMAMALTLGTDSIWILDDDNLPRPGCLATALDIHGEDGQPAVLCLRPGRPRHQMLIQGRSPAEVFGPDSGFCGFDVLDRVTAPFRRRSGGPAGPAVRNLPSAAWGGLLVSRRAVELVGLPRSELFVYEDDTEWTERLAGAGTEIVAARGALIDEMETSWYNPTQRRSPGQLLHAEHPDKMYYQFRNRAHLGRLKARSRIRYRLNRAVFMALMAMTAAVTGRRDAYALLHQAVSDGEGGRLGRRPPSPGVSP